MTAKPPKQRNRVLVPFELAPFLRGPHGWTNEMRRREGYPRGVRGQPLHLGFWRSVGVALLLYGPMAVGAVLGGRAWGGWAGAGAGAFLGLMSQAGVILLVGPVVALVRRSR